MMPPHRYSERAKKNIRLQLELKRDIYKQQFQYWGQRNLIYKKFKSEGMKGLERQISETKKRETKNEKHLERVRERILDLRASGQI